MKVLLSLLFILFFSSSHCLEKLSEKYLVTFGSPDAPTKITLYFSLACPHCLSMYREDFQKIKAKYIESKQIAWNYHPVPMDFLTVQAMDCLEKLSDTEKRIFLESILDVMPIDDSILTVCYMKKAMELFEKPIDELTKKEYLSNTQAFQDAFLFIKQKDRIQAVPTLEIDGELFFNEIPSLDFLDRKIKLKEEQKL